MSITIPQTQYLAAFTREDVIESMTSTPERAETWNRLPSESQEELIKIYMKQKILKIIYDRVFKFIFDINLHPGRLDRFVSQILGEEIHIIQVLPSEQNNYLRRSKLIYFDILVEFSDHRRANIEMQVLGYRFPNTRAAIYSSSLILSQYTSLRGQYLYATGTPEDEFKDDTIDYSKIHKVYTIVLMENSTGEFHKHPDFYLHHGTQTFNSGLELDMLQEYIYITLDTFRDLIHDPDTELEAWLAFLSAETMSEIDHIIQKFPYFQIIKDDVIMYGETNPEEVLHMYIEGIELFDHADRMIDLRETKAKNERLMKEMEQKNNMLAQKDSVLAQKDSALAQKDSALAQKEAEIAHWKSLAMANSKSVTPQKL